MRRYGVLLVMLGSVLWGTDTLFRRPLTSELSPVTIVFLEHVVLVFVTLPILVRGRREIAALSKKDWAAIATISVGGSVVATSLFTFAIKHGNPSVTVLLQKTQPLVTIALARAVLGERPRRWLWPWVFPAIAGTYLLSVPEWSSPFRPDSARAAAVAASLAASLLWGISTVLGRYVAVRLPAFVLTGLRFALALPVLVALYVSQTAEARALPAAGRSLAAIVGMALVPGLAALVIYYRGLQSTSASIACMGELAFPLTAVGATWLILGIGLSPSQIIGGIVLVTAMTALTLLNAKEPSGGPAGSR